MNAAEAREGRRGDPPEYMDRLRFPVDPWRLDRERLRPFGPRHHRDPLRRGQRLPRPARKRRGGARLLQPRHLHQRFPRDVAHHARRGGVRPCARRPDHRQRSGPQDHPSVRRRRAAAAVDRGPSGVLAHARHAHRRAHPRPAVAHARREPRPRALAAHGVVLAASPRRDDLRGLAARQGGADRDLLPAAQPPGGPRRVSGARSERNPRQRDQRHPGSPQGRRPRRARARAEDARRRRRSRFCSATRARSRG